MNLTKKITLALGVLAAATASYAQTSPTSPAVASQGLLGTQYTELNFGVHDIRHFSDHSYHAGIGANTPLVPGVIDAGANYTYSWIRGPFSGHTNTIGGYSTAYTILNGVKPFVGGALGYQWAHYSFGRDTQGLWGATVGVEIPAGALTITPRINYADDFERSFNSSQEFTYQVEANYWVNAKTAVFGSIGKSDVRRSPFDSWNYEIGLRARF